MADGRVVIDTKLNDKPLKDGIKGIEGVTVNSVNAVKKALTTAGIAAMAIAAVKQIANLVKGTMELTDRIDKMSQKIGMSRKGFQEWDYILEQNGASVDGLQMSMKTLATQAEAVTKGGAESTKMFKRLGVEVRDTNGNLKDQEQLFKEVFLALSDVESETERTALASRLLGRSATELAPAMNQGSKAIEDLREEAHKLGIVYSDELIDAGVQLNDNMLRIRSAARSLTENALAPLVSGLVTVTDKMLGQYNASGNLDTALANAKRATDLYKKAQEDAKDPTDALTKAMLEQARIEMDISIRALSAEWNKSSKAFRIAQDEIGRLTDGMLEADHLIEQMKRRVEEDSGEPFYDVIMGSPDQTAYKAWLEIIEGNAERIERINAGIADSTKLRADFVNALTEAYIDFDLDLTHLVESESDLYDMVMKNVDAVKGARQAQGLYNDLQTDTIEQVDELIAIYETYQNMNKDNVRWQGMSAEMLNRLTARRNELLDEEARLAGEAGKATKTQKKIFDEMRTALGEAEKMHQALGKHYDISARKAEIYTEAILALKENGMEPTNDVITTLRHNIDRLNVSLSEPPADDTPEVIEGWGGAWTAYKKHAKKELDDIAGLATRTYDNISRNIQQALGDGVRNFVTFAFNQEQILADLADSIDDITYNMGRSTKDLERAQDRYNRAVASGDKKAIQDAKERLNDQKRIVEGQEKQLKALQDEEEAIESGAKAWGEFGKAILEALASTLYGLGAELAARAVLAAVTFNFAGAAAAGLASGAAFAAGALLESWAGSFADGGIVPQVAGLPSSGDRHLASVNPGELILNQAQQANLATQLSGGITIHIEAVHGLDSADVGRAVYRNIKTLQSEGVLSRW